MVEMTRWQWFYTAWLSQGFLYGAITAVFFLPMAPFAFLFWLIIGPVSMWIGPWFMWGERTGKDFPSGSYADNHAISIFEIDLQALSKMFVNMLIQFLDIMRTPGGLKINEESISNWRTALDDEDLFGNPIEIYIFDWWQMAVIKNQPDIVDQEDGDYLVAHLLIDLFFLAAMIGLTVLLAKKGKQMVTGVASAFSYVATKRRRKGSKQREKIAIQKLDQLAEENKMIREQTEILKIKKKLYQEIGPDVVEIKNRKNTKLRL